MKMNSTKGSARARLLTSTLLAGLATIAAPLAVTAIATAVPTLASAQDYTSGTLVGSVTDSAGAPVAGASVIVKSTNTGISRSLTTNSDGQFRAPLIPLGGYVVNINKDGFEPIASSAATVRLGGESAYGFTLLHAGEVDAVVVTGTANPQLDFAATTTGLSVDVEELSKQVPVGRSITALTLLAPGAVKGSAASQSNGALISAQPAVAGASGAENAFYVNGLNITNFNTYLGGATVPFDFYKTVEVKTGGYPAEFGRATGGVINAVTKSGGNEFHVRIHGNYQPNSLSDTSPDTFQDANHRDVSKYKDLVTEVSGPIIEDHLFFYVLNQQRSSEDSASYIEDAQTIVDKSNDPFWGVKLDGYVTDRQHLELTWFDTTRQIDRTIFDYDGTTDKIGDQLSTTTRRFGGPSYVAKYTGTFTDWFTLSAAYGQSDDSDSSLPSNTTSPYITDQRDPNNVRLLGPQRSTTTSITETNREFYRVDGDLYFNLIGKHHVRFGIDNEKLTLNRASTPVGGQSYTYNIAGTSDKYGIASGQQYMTVVTYLNGGVFNAENQALYIQDSWDLTNRFSLQLGLRSDSFKNMNSDGDVFINYKNYKGPRLGFSYDVTGDAKTKVSGSFGRYFLPVASNTAYRQTGGELYFTEVFLMGSQPDATTGLATRGTQVLNFAAAAPCPAGGVGAAGVNGCEVTGDGSATPITSTVAQGLKPTYEDEYILSLQRQFSPLWRAGVNLTYRTLGRSAEDVAIDAAVNAYCIREFGSKSVAGCSRFTGFHQYTIINPGEAATITLRRPVNGEATARTITFSAAELGYPKVKREYIALEANFERAFDGKWSLQGSYVLSESKGNYEGAVKSDVGQIDSGITQDFDQPGLTDGSYGLLPNHRGHQFKAFGAYALTENLLLGANASIISPKHLGCLGVHPTDRYAAVYGAGSFYCQGKPTPRGSVSKTDWTKNLDLSLKYTVPTFDKVPGTLSLRAEVFNVFNSKAIANTWEFGDLDTGAVDTRYGKPTSYQAPRYVRIGFDWEY
jgi:hypothetical protein